MQPEIDNIEEWRRRVHDFEDVDATVALVKGEALHVTSMRVTARRRGWSLRFAGYRYPFAGEILVSLSGIPAESYGELKKAIRSALEEKDADGYILAPVSTITITSYVEAGTSCNMIIVGFDSKRVNETRPMPHRRLRSRFGVSFK